MDKKKTKEPFYIYEIPMPIRMKLTNLLDIHDGWKKLAVEAGFGTHEILSFDKAFRRPTGSPSDDLLHEWGTKNATIRRLFEALRNINHIQEMKLLKPIVPSEYHHMIPEDDDIDQSSPNAPHKLKSFGEDNLKLPRPFDPVESSGMTPPPQSVVESSWGLANGSSVNYYNGHPSMGSHYDSKIPDKNIELHYASSCGPVPNMAAPSTVLYERKSQDMFGGIAVSSTPHFKYEDIKQATKNFNVPNKIGEGTFGAVYLANFHKTIYAVKVFNDQALHNTDQKDCRSHWKTELSTLMVYRHPNIIQLCGDSFDGPRPCLLFEYMVNGSLEDRLECKNQTPPLSWLQRVNIILGASTGINFLHTVCERPLIHGDIKSANVLLDKHFEAKIADFGLAVTANKRNDMGKYTHITKEDRKVVLATLAYLPPDFVQSRKFSIRSDVYSFGVVLFEVGSGQKAFDEKREPMDHQKLVEFASDALTSDDCLRQKLYDPHLIGCSRHLVDILFKLALTCTDESPRRRPEMGQVVDDLDSLLKQSYGQGSYGPQHQQQHLYQQQQQQLHHHLQQQQQQQQQQQHVQQQQQHVQQQQQHVQLQQQPHSVTLYQNLTAGGGEPASFHFSHHSSSPASASLMEANNSMIPITVPQNPSLKSDEVSSSLFTRQESVKHPSLSCLGKQQGLPTANHVSSDPEVESYQCDRKIPSADDQVLRKFNPSVVPGEKPSPMELQKMYDAERLAAEKLRQIEASDGLYENVAAMVSSTEDAKCLEWDHSKLPPEETQCQTEQVDTADHHVTPLELEKQFYEQRENLRVGHNGDVRHSEPPTCVPHPGVADGDKLLPSPQESMKAKKKLPFALEEYYEQVGQDMASLNLTDDQSLAPPPPCRPWHANESEGCLKSEECISGASTGSCESGDTCCTLTPARGSTAGESDEQQSITSITFDGDI